MTCAACSARLEKVLNRQSGMQATVNLAAERAQLEAALAARTLRIDAAFEASLAALADHLGAQGVVALPEPAPSGYQPNVVPRGARLGRTAAALFVLFYAVRGLFVDDLVIEFPVRKHLPLGGGLHLHGVVAWTMAAAMLCAVAVLLSAVMDHYDTRDNEAAYQRFAAKGYKAAWTLGIVGRADARDRSAAAHPGALVPAGPGLCLPSRPRPPARPGLHRCRHRPSQPPAPRRR